MYALVPSMLPLASLAAFFLSVAPALAQPDPSQPEHVHHAEDHVHERPDNVSIAQEGSGTSLLPYETPSYALHRHAGEWMLMAHWQAFLQYIVEGSNRGDDQLGSVNWLMGSASHALGSGRLQMRGMISLEPATIPGCGYPDLLASGEECKGDVIHDRQHPHDLFMELAAIYDRPITRRVSLQLYAAPVGEPALGPVAFPHRQSAASNLVAPITHHWFDATHVSFGVLTAAAYGRSWKAETSQFNGREPDERRTDFDFASLDSWSARFWFLPTRRWALQASGGHLHEVETGQNGVPATDVTRVTASATYHRMTAGHVWASTLGWAQNRGAGAAATGAMLAEGSLTVEDRDTWFGRFELSEKTGRELGLESDDVVGLAKVQAGYTRYLSAWHGLKAGFGGSVSASIVPEQLKPAYGSRLNAGLAVFLAVRPAGRAPDDLTRSAQGQSRQ
jgi:hypothetical protein